MTNTEIQKQLRSLKIQNLKNKTDDFNKFTLAAMKQLQARCEHYRIKKGGPDYSGHDFWYKCLDCDKMFYQKSLTAGEQGALEKNIVEDVS